MNYPANTIQWKPGDLVLHDCDAKREDMLMRVVKYLPSGQVKAHYVNEKWRKRQRSRKSGVDSWFDLADLHDPARFGVAVSTQTIGGAA